MLGFRRFPTQLQHNVVFQNPITNYLQLPPQSHFPHSARLNLEAVLVKTRSGLCCNALKTNKKGGYSVKGTDEADEFEDEDFDVEFVEDGNGGGELDEDEDDVFIPLKDMKKWLERRPRGFGEGKVYDTTIEDQLMEEIEQSRVAQLANVKKLKENPLKPTPKKDKEPQPIHDGFRVRLVNLPKKKNIHKDLRLAFQGFPGIVNIVPVVSGNEKTRDPVCKGFAFVDFKKENEAHRFVQKFTGKSIAFGKVEKQIKCEMVNLKLPKAECDQSVDGSNDPSRQSILNSNEATDGSLLHSSEESVASEVSDADERRDVSGQWEEDDGGINVASTTTGSDLADEPDEGKESAIDTKQTRKAKKRPKKVASRRVKANVPTLDIPGSAKKLKIREQAVLSGVFSKYGAAAASTVKVKEQSR
ncbi:uncharacterized protein LOC130993679 [Salvia miltiorrhiza]|uniref:uncharacterized protein LOC130993679 n=1 Tax=Salvia miltiorrhiza TaxID=226208 RepID=UPI0025AC63AD|nr:uncharacterized protein LOC130993679 [Salvia miltiorrhiza]